MPRKRVNRRKNVKSSRKSQKTASTKRQGCVVPSFLIVIFVCAGMYTLASYMMSLTDVECVATDYESKRMWTREADLGFVVGTKYSTSIRTCVKEYIKRATKLLVLDCGEIPFGDDSEISSLLIKEQLKKPGLSIYLIVDKEDLGPNNELPEKYVNLKAAGITIVFIDNSKIRDYYWFYSPFGWLADEFDLVLPFIEKLRDKGSSRNIVVSQSHSQIYAMTGNYSLLNNTGQVELAASLVGKGAYAIAKNELYLIREFIEDESAVFNAKGISRVKLSIESNIKGILDFTLPTKGESVIKVFTESTIESNVVEVIDGALIGDKMDLFVGALNSSDITDALIRAKSRGVDIRIVFDKNTLDEEPTVPNALAVDSLLSSASTFNLKWLEGHRTNISFVHIYNRKRKYSSVLLLSAPMTEQAMNYNFATGIWVENVPSHSQRLEALFATYLTNNATRHIYSSDHDKYKIGFFDWLILTLKNLRMTIFGEVL